MSKFHINKHGVPAPCKAKQGNCPLGGENLHFSSEEEAQAFINNQMENEYGLLGGTPSDKEESSFKVLNVEEQNHFFDSRKSSNGGGYHQPLIDFTFNGVEGHINDTSCGDFGKRVHIEYKDKSYYLDTINEYEEYSSFSKECLEDKLLSEHLKEMGYSIIFKEDL